MIIVVAALGALDAGAVLRDPQFDPSALLGPAVLALVVLWPFLVPETGRIRILRGGLAAGLGLCSVVVAVSAAAGAQNSPLAAVLVPFQAVGLVVGVGLSLVGLPLLAVAAPLGDAGLLVMSAICLTAILASVAVVARRSAIGLRGRFAALASLIVALVAVGAFATFLLGPDHWGPIEFQDVIDSMAAGFLLIAAIAALAWIARVIRVWPARTGDRAPTTSGDTQGDDLDAVTQREPLGQASFRRSLPGSASARKERPVNLKVMTTRWRVAITIGFVIGAVTGWGSESKYKMTPPASWRTRSSMVCSGRSSFSSSGGCNSASAGCWPAEGSPR
jgi:hypothetical protein